MSTVLVKQCCNCNEEKGQPGFYKKQWKKASGSGYCKPCWDDLSRQPSTKKQKTTTNDGSASIANAKKKKILQAECSRCRTAVIVSNKREKREFRHCHQCKQERQEIEKKEYFLQSGVPYEQCPRFIIRKNGKLRKEPVSNEELLGTYKLVFYNSDRFAQPHLIHRTLKGSMELSVTKWNEKPALYGKYQVDIREHDFIFNTERIYICDEGETSSSAHFVEEVTDEKAYRRCHGFNVQDEDEAAARLFVLGRDAPRRENKTWFHGIDEEHESDTNDEFCGAAIQVVSERFALGLAVDDLPFLKCFRPKYVGEKPKDIDHANEMMAKYMDGSNTWMWKHLNLPDPSIAFKIREFLMPPPVLFVEPGDLVLSVEESVEVEWNKTLIFRKETNSSA